MFGCFLLAFLPYAVSPEAEGVSSARLQSWIDACERRIDMVHGFVLLRHGKVVAEGSWKPYDTLNETHSLSSHSKCFITTAAGILVDEGRLDLDECVVDLLADKVPANPSEHLRRVRVRDLLSMNMGGSVSDNWVSVPDGDCVKAILARQPDQRPGEYFHYDSGATHLLCAILERKTGQPLMKFLQARLFGRLGIEKAWSTYDPKGLACGGWGFNMTTREICRIGQLYLDKGVWKGERIVSEDWATLATVKQTWTGKSPLEYRTNKSDWVQGFGFNFWRCQHGFYRADGAGGQFTIVMPRHDAVLSINSDVMDMQHVLDVVWEDFLPCLSETALPEDAAAAAALKTRCANLALKPVEGRRDGGEKFLGLSFAFENAPTALKGVRMTRAEDGWRLALTTEAGTFELPVGYNEWMQGTMRFTDWKYADSGRIVGTQRMASSAAVQQDGSVRVRILRLGGARRIDLHFRSKFFKPVVLGEVAGVSKEPFVGRPD